jgi:hypothetical protein
MASGERIDNRFATDDPRPSYDTMNAPTRPGTGYMSRSEFESLSGMTETNPYGKKGFFSRVFGIDPSKVDYTNNLGPQGIENVKIQAYDRFMNPFAQEDAFGRPTMGANFSQGTTRSGVRPGDQTIFGPAASGQAEGIASFLQNMPGIFGMAGRSMAPTVIPGTVGSDARGQDRGIYDFNIPDNMDQLVSSALRQDAFDARDPAAILETIDRGIFTTDDDSPSGAVDYDGYPEMYDPFAVRGTVDRGIFESDDEAAAFEELTGVQTQVPVTTAEILATPSAVGRIPGYIDPVIDPNTGMVIQGTGVVPPQGPQVIQNIGTGDPGTATMSPRDVPIDTTVFPEDEAPIDLTAGVGEELLGTRSTAAIDRSDDPAFARVLQSMLGPADVAQMRDRDAKIAAIRNALVAQGMNPTLASQRARMQVGG